MLKAVCSPQITRRGVGGIQVSIVVYSGILEELLSVFDNQVLWFECSLSTRCVGLCELQLRFMAHNCPMGHKNVLCFPSDNGWGSLTYVQWSKLLNKKNANNRKTASCHKRGLILHIGSLSQNYLSSDTNLDLKQILVKFNSPRQLGYQVDKPQ